MQYHRAQIRASPAGSIRIHSPKRDSGRTPRMASINVAAADHVGQSAACRNIPDYRNRCTRQRCHSVGDAPYQEFNRSAFEMDVGTDASALSSDSGNAPTSRMPFTLCNQPLMPEGIYSVTEWESQPVVPSCDECSVRFWVLSPLSQVEEEQLRFQTAWAPCIERFGR